MVTKALPSKVWEEALERYKNGLEGSDQKRFEAAFRDSSDYHDVLTTAEITANTSSHKFSSYFRTVLAPFIELAPIFDVVSQVNGSIGCAIWGPLKLIIQVASFLSTFDEEIRLTRKFKASAKYSEGLEKILEVLEALSINMQRYEIVERIHKEPFVRRVLENFYFDFIDFCARCIKYQNRGKFVNGIRSAVKPFSVEAKEVIANIERHGRAIDNTAAILEMEKSDAFRSMTNLHLNNQSIENVAQASFRAEQAQKELQEQQRKIRIWLNPTNFEDEQKRRQKEHIANTNSWFLMHPSFQDWIVGDTQLLWAYGKPGSGKSVLASSIVARLQSLELRPLYFFFNSKLSSVLNAGPLRFIGTFLVQLIVMDPELCQSLYELYNRSNTDEAASFDTLWEVFRNWCSSRKTYLYCIIDALDEGLDQCEEPDEFLATLLSISKEFPTIRMLVMSRPNHRIGQQLYELFGPQPDILDTPSGSAVQEFSDADDLPENAFKLVAHVLISEDQVRSDIEVYVKDKVKRTAKLKAWIAQSDIENICSRSEGMFLWARFVLEELQTATSRNALKAKLDKAPKSLQKMYELILERLQTTLDEDQIQLCRKILEWVTTSKESLTVNQLTIVVAIRSGDKTIDEGELLFDPRHEILAVYAPLVEILSDDTVRIVHLSAKEFLFGKNGLDKQGPLSLSFASANADIATVLLTLLSFDEFCAAKSLPGPVQTSSEDTESLLNAWFMLTYSLRYWYLHCVETGSSPPALEILPQVHEYVASDNCFLWMERIARTESGATWVHIENQLSEWEQELIPQESQVLGRGLIKGIAERRWKYMKSSLGEDNPETLTALANLAYTHGNLGEWAIEQEMEVSVLQGRRSILGEDHPDTLVAMANLAWTYWNQGNFSDAEIIEKEVLASREKTLGKNHVDTLTAMANLAGTYQKLGKRAEAAVLELAVLEGRRKILGDNHEDTITAMGYVAASVAHGAMGFFTMGLSETKDAEALDLEVLENCKRVLGPKHPETLRALGRLIRSYQTQEKYDDAAKLGREAVEGCSKVFGDRHPETLSAMASLALTYSKQGLYHEAELLQTQVLQYREIVLGEQHPDTLEIKAALENTRLRKQPDSDLVSTRIDDSTSIRVEMSVGLLD